VWRWQNPRPPWCIHYSFGHVVVIPHFTQYHWGGEGLCLGENFLGEHCCWERVSNCWQEDHAISHGGFSSSEWTLAIYFLEHLATFVQHVGFGILIAIHADVYS